MRLFDVAGGAQQLSSKTLYLKWYQACQRSIRKPLGCVHRLHVTQEFTAEITGSISAFMVTFFLEKARPFFLHSKQWPIQLTCLSMKSDFCLVLFLSKDCQCLSPCTDDFQA